MPRVSFKKYLLAGLLTLLVGCVAESYRRPFARPKIDPSLPNNERILHGRLDSQGCLQASDKNSYKLLGANKSTLQSLGEAFGKTIIIRGTQAKELLSHNPFEPKCGTAFEVVTWTHYPDGDKPEQWDTYRNPYYGYEFKIPRWWDHRIPKPLDLSYIAFGPAISIVIERKEMSRSDWRARFFGTEILEEGDIIVDGRHARKTKTLLDFKQQIPEEVIEFETEKYLVKIINSDADNFDAEQTPHDMLRTMLTTFRWPSGMPDESVPQGWSRYQNQKFRYSFYVPPSWTRNEFGSAAYFQEKPNPRQVFRVNVAGHQAGTGNNYPSFLAPFAGKKWEEIFVDGMVSFLFPDDGLIYIPHRDSVHLLAIYFPRESRAIAEQILRTLRFYNTNVP